MGKIPPGFNKASNEGYTRKINKDDLLAKKQAAVEKHTAEMAARNAQKASKAASSSNPPYKVNIKNKSMLPGLLPGGPESGESTLEKINELSPENKRPDSPSELENPPVNKATVPKSAANSPYFSDNPEVKRARARDLLSMPFLKPEERKVLGEILAQDEKKK